VHACISDDVVIDDVVVDNVVVVDVVVVMMWWLMWIHFCGGSCSFPSIFLLYI